VVNNVTHVRLSGRSRISAGKIAVSVSASKESALRAENLEEA
jgi:hypothetical protein